MPRFTLPVVLGALLLGAAVFGTAQLAEAKKLRTGLAALDQERAELRKRVWELQKLNGDLAARLDRGSAGPGGAKDSAENGAPPEEAAPAGRPPRPEGNRFASLINNPEVQQLMALQQKAGLDGRYAALFKRLNLSPADLEKLKNLLVEKQAAVMDVMAAARSQGLTGRESRDEIRQLVQDAQGEVDDTIRATLGDAGFAQYKNYEATLPQRGVVSQLDQRLSYSPTPLTDTQSDQLVQILASTSPATGAANRSTALSFAQSIPGAAQSVALMGGGTRITDEAIVQAQGVLTAPQLAALQSLQQEQKAAAQLTQQMRINRENTPRGNTPAATPPPPGGG